MPLEELAAYYRFEYLLANDSPLIDLFHMQEIVQMTSNCCNASKETFVSQITPLSLSISRQSNTLEQYLDENYKRHNLIDYVVCKSCKVSSFFVQIKQFCDSYTE